MIAAGGWQVLWVKEQSYNRPCGAAVKGRQVGVGKPGDCVHKVQQQEGQQEPEAAWLEAQKQTQGKCSACGISLTSGVFDAEKASKEGFT